LRKSVGLGFWDHAGAVGIAVDDPCFAFHGGWGLQEAPKAPQIVAIMTTLLTAKVFFDL
jgi:hypothetical protein